MTTPSTDRTWTRRDFMAAGLLSTAAVATGSGCRTNPVTGKRQFMLYGRSWEISMDEQYSPHQFSSDYGALQDARLNAYLQERLLEVGAVSHRPNMPYTVRALNVSMANGYTFPAGSMAVTRGLLLEMGSEAELMALIGHETGHVTARHTASRFSSQLLTQLLVLGAAVAVGYRDEDAGMLVAGLGLIGSGLLLARYSRNDERQADELGIEYASGAGYPPQGMIDLHGTLIRLYGNRRNIIERMFASHPMSKERLETAIRDTKHSRYAHTLDLDPRRERYMDMTAGVRAQGDAIRKIQEGDKSLQDKSVEKALTAYREAVRIRPTDYEALLKAAKGNLHLKKPAEARSLAQDARAAYPEEPQAIHVLAMAELDSRRFTEARNGFAEYGRILPGNPETGFYLGRSEEGLGRRPEAGQHYKAYLDAGASGPNADHARARLVEWGMLPAA